MINTINNDIVKIYNVCNTLISDPNIGPCNKTVLNDFFYGIKSMPKNIYDINGKSWKGHLGYTGWECCHYNNFFNKNSTNLYSVELCSPNYSKDIIMSWEKQQKICYEKYTKSLFRRIYDLSNETKTNQSNFGKCLGIPRSFSNSKTQKDRVIAELIYRSEHYGLIKTKKEGGKRIILPGNPNNIPENIYNLKFKMDKRCSKYEACVNSILKKIPKINSKWQVTMSEFKKAPYDFGIFNKNDQLLGLIEVQGEQHQRRINHFHKTESDFLNRIKIDKKKKEIAIKNDLIYLEITAETLKNKKSKQIKKIIEDKFCNH